MGAALVLLLVGLGALAAGGLIGRYYVPDDRQLRRTARHSRAYMRALSHLVAREHEAAIGELRAVVEENVDDSEPYFALGAMFRSRGEHERAIRVHQWMEAVGKLEIINEAMGDGGLVVQPDAKIHVTLTMDELQDALLGNRREAVGD